MHPSGSSSEKLVIGIFQGKILRCEQTGSSPRTKGATCLGGGQSVTLAGRVLHPAASLWGWSILNSNEMTQPHLLQNSNYTLNVPSGMAVEDKKWQLRGEKKYYSIRVLNDSKHLGKKWMQDQSDIQMFSIYKWKGLCSSTSVAHLGKLQLDTRLVKKEQITVATFPTGLYWIGRS